MSLTAKSLFLYGFEITLNNRNIPFRAVGAGPELNAVLPLGFYSLSELLTEVKAQMEVVDTANTYTASTDRTVLGGTENRTTISTSGGFLELLFGSGATATTSVALLLGYTLTDKTGATSYTGTSTAGIALVPTEVGYNYKSPERSRKLFGQVNVTPSGLKEAIVFSTQKFWEVQFKYETVLRAETVWVGLADWLIEQKPFEFTREITSPTAFDVGTLEKTQIDGKGLGWHMPLMLPEFPFLCWTDLLTFRVKET